MLKFFYMSNVSTVQVIYACFSTLLPMTTQQRNRLSVGNESYSNVQSSERERWHN